MLALVRLVELSWIQRAETTIAGFTCSGPQLLGVAASWSHPKTSKRFDVPTSDPHRVLSFCRGCSSPTDWPWLAHQGLRAGNCIPVAAGFSITASYRRCAHGLACMMLSVVNIFDWLWPRPTCWFRGRDSLRSRRGQPDSVAAQQTLTTSLQEFTRAWTQGGRVYKNQLVVRE
jgi:hypothetical protein